MDVVRTVYTSVRRDTKQKQINGVIVGFRVKGDGKVGERLGQWSSKGVHPRHFDLATVKLKGVYNACCSG